MRKLHIAIGFSVLAAGLVIVPPVVESADHGDTPFLVGAGRHDARLTDLHTFRRGDNLVLAVAMNPAIPPSATSYVFPSDLVVEINIDNNTPVTQDDSILNGGIIHDPEGISADIKYRVTFSDSGTPSVHTIPGTGPDPEQVFAGLRDDPFIRAPRTGRNIAAIVLEVPLASVLDGQSTILTWATVRLDGQGMVELGARALRNQFPENLCLNNVEPRHHLRECNLAPDVIIYDTSRTASFPNGRELADDVTDLVGDPRLLSNDQPFPTENDVPFLDVFPYYAPPQ